MESSMEMMTPLGVIKLVLIIQYHFQGMVRKLCMELIVTIHIPGGFKLLIYPPDST